VINLNIFFKAVMDRAEQMLIDLFT